MKPFPRNGAWAVLNAKVGLLQIEERVNRQTGVITSRKQLHVADEDGHTIEVVNTSWSGARIATRAEIPPSRIAGMSPSVLATLGYL